MATIIFFLLIAFSILLAIFSKRGHPTQSAKDFFVASGQFNTFLVFFLSAGEIYSTATMVGLPGGIYAKGPTYGVWLLGYILLAYPVGYFLGPKIWEAGRRYDAVTLPDLFAKHFNCRWLEIIIAVTAILFLLPWGQLQFTGLIAALDALGWQIKPTYLVAISAILAFTYVAISGIRASAYIAILKDVLMVVAIVVVGVAVSTEVGVSTVFRAAHAKFSNAMSSKELVFSMSTILFQSIGFYVLPFNVQNIFTAKSSNTIRRTQIFMPLYMFMFPFLIVSAYYAISQNLNLTSPNQAFFVAATRLLPNWLIGVIAAATALSGLVVLAGICLGISSIFTRNIISNLPESRQKGSAKIVIVGYLLISIALTLLTPNLMLTLVNTAYNGITQFFPGVIIVLLSLRVRAVAVAAGLLVGQILTIILYVNHTDLYGFNVGLISLIVNVVVVLVMTLMARQSAVAPSVG